MNRKTRLLQSEDSESMMIDGWWMHDEHQEKHHHEQQSHLVWDCLVAVPWETWHSRRHQKRDLICREVINEDCCDDQGGGSSRVA